MSVHIILFKYFKYLSTELLRFGIAAVFCQFVQNDKHFFTRLRLLEILFAEIMSGTNDFSSMIF